MTVVVTRGFTLCTSKSAGSSTRCWLLRPLLFVDDRSRAERSTRFVSTIAVSSCHLRSSIAVRFWWLRKFFRQYAKAFCVGSCRTRRQHTYALYAVRRSESCFANDRRALSAAWRWPKGVTNG